MVAERPPLAMRPLHAWFQLWETIIPSLYRVVAVLVAAALTTMLVATTTPTPWLLAALLATGGWVPLAIVEEHGARVVLPVDGEFLSLLRSGADEVLRRVGFSFHSASGPVRARRDRSDAFLYEAGADAGAGRGGCIDLWIYRDRAPGGAMDVTVDGRPLEWLLTDLGESQLAEHITHTEDAAGDVAGLVAAFRLVFPATSD